MPSGSARKSMVPRRQFSGISAPGQPDVYRGVLVRLRPGESTERALHFRDRHAVRIARRILAHRRKEHVLVLRHRLVEKFIRVQAKVSGSKNMTSKTMARGFWASMPCTISPCTERGHGQRPAGSTIRSRLDSSAATTITSGSALVLPAWVLTNRSEKRGLCGKEPVQPGKFKEGRDHDRDEQQD